MFVLSGSIRMSVAPSDFAPLGRVVAPLRRVQVTPPFFDSQIPYAEWTGGVVRWAPPRPRRTVAYRWLALAGSTARREMETPMKKSPDTCAHVVPPSVDFKMPLPK